MNLKRLNDSLVRTKQGKWIYTSFKIENKASRTAIAGFGASRENISKSEDVRITVKN